VGLLDGKVVIISGAARGQGRAHAVLSAREGADVIIFDINAQVANVPYGMGTSAELKETARQVHELGRRSFAATADVRSLEQMSEVVERGLAEFGRIDAVISNHDIVNWSSFWEMTEEMWDDVIETNLTGVWKLVRAVAPHMIERRSGSIVITSSVNGIRPSGAFAHYVSSKHGAIGLMRSVARELAPYNVRCNAVLPGPTMTPMIDSQAQYDLITGHPDATREQMLLAGYHATALRNRTWQEPEEIAKAALFFNSDLATNITGQTLAVEAGALLLDGYNHSPARD
jgi:SDR family mycofactocin-dependent oxidoreductase